MAIKFIFLQSTQNRGVSYFLDTMQTGADQRLKLGCMSPAVDILSLSITSFLARGVVRAGSFIALLFPVSILWVAKSV